MNTYLKLFFFFLIGFSAQGNSQSIVLEEDFQTSIPTTWATVDLDGLTPALASPAFTTAWIHYTASGDSCAASTSYYDTIGQSQDYLITPKISLGTYNKMVWDAKSVDASYPEDYVILISTTDSLTGNFTDTLHLQSEEVPYWITRSVNLDSLGYNNQDVYIAIKNISEDKFILLVDNFRVLSSENASLTETNTSFEIYPNPAKNTINIKTSATVSFVEIYDLQGKLILTSSQKSINLDALQKGQYILKIYTDKDVQTEKFIKK